MSDQKSTQSTLLSPRRSVALAAAVAALVGGVAGFGAGLMQPVPQPHLHDAAQTADPARHDPDELVMPATVTSSCGPDSDPEAVLSGDPNRAWVCEPEKQKRLIMDFAKPTAVSGICLMPGVAHVDVRGEDRWELNLRITGVIVESGGAHYHEPVTPLLVWTCVRFAPEHVNRRITLTLSSFTGTDWTTRHPHAAKTAVSGVKVFGPLRSAALS
jgi:hypothetical protein